VPRRLIAGTLLVLVGLASWVLYLTQSGGAEQHSYNRAGHPPADVRLVEGGAYSIAIHGGVDREIRLGLDPASLQCTAAPPGRAAVALELSTQGKDTKATNEIATFYSPVSGSVRVRCSGIGAVYVDDAEDASYDWSGVWLVLASVALAVGIPLGLSGLRGPGTRPPEPNEPVEPVEPSGVRASSEYDQIQ
jgi:hypothetical protein